MLDKQSVSAQKHLAVSAEKHMRSSSQSKMPDSHDVSDQIGGYREHAASDPLIDGVMHN